MTGKLYALLVGIDHYLAPDLTDLRGCVADVLGTQSFLRTRLALPAEQIILLTARTEELGAPMQAKLATRQNILDSWQQLIDLLEAGDQFFFHFSGHGSQARTVDPNNPSGYDESISCHDSRTAEIDQIEVYDIIDKELAALIRETEKKGALVTIFLDCCHSGSGTRQGLIDAAVPRVRACPRDERVRPVASLVPGAFTGSHVPSSTRAFAPDASTIGRGNGWHSADLAAGHVLLAGCRDVELSNEYLSPETGQWQGATSYFLHRALAAYHPAMRWADVHDLVQTQVHAIYPTQTPQLEGPANRQIFGGLSHEVAGYLIVTEVDGGFFARLNGGAAIGLTTGSRVALYPPASDRSGPPTAVGVVDTVQVDSAWLLLDPPVAIAPASRAKIVDYAIADQTQFVATADALLLEKIATAASGEPSPFLSTLALAEDASDAPSAEDISTGRANGARYFVRVADGFYVIENGAGTRVVAATHGHTAAGAEQVVKQLEHMSIYQNILRLQNPRADSTLGGSVGFEVEGLEHRRRFAIEEQRERLEIAQRVWLQLSIENRWEKDVHITIFELAPDFAIRQVYPHQRSINQRLRRGAKDQHKLLPTALAPSTDRDQQYVYKLFATETPLNLQTLRLPPLTGPKYDEGELYSQTRSSAASSLAQLVNAIRVEGTRMFQMGADADKSEWTTLQRTVWVQTG